MPARLFCVCRFRHLSRLVSPCPNNLPGRWCHQSDHVGRVAQNCPSGHELGLSQKEIAASPPLPRSACDPCCDSRGAGGVCWSAGVARRTRLPMPGGVAAPTHSAGHRIGQPGAAIRATRQAGWVRIARRHARCPPSSHMDSLVRPSFSMKSTSSLSHSSMSSQYRTPLSDGGRTDPYEAEVGVSDGA